MKKIWYLLVVVLLFGGFVLNVSAISTTVSSSVKMPDSLTYDKDSSISFSVNVTNVYYQIQNISNDDAESIKAIEDAIANESDQDSKQTLEDELTRKKEALVVDPDSSLWKEAKDNKISSSGIEKDNYYVVWVKATQTSDSSDIFNYQIYKAVASSFVKSPETGVETTLLYIGVSISLIFGVYLLNNKNKKVYE